VPHKEIAAEAVESPTDRVRRLAACNTFWFEDGKLMGENTDVDGLLAALEDLEAPSTAWLIAGTGGAARAAVAAASERRAAVAVRSRDPGRRSRFEAWVSGQGVTLVPKEDCQVLINATPLGLHAGDHLPIALDEAPGALAALDMVYAREETPWVRAMRRAGLRAADGRSMLVAQGATAFKRWFPEEAPPIEVMRAAVANALR
jgi:shikimate dehydrogenase